MVRAFVILLLALLLAGCGTPMPPPAYSVNANGSPVSPAVLATQGARMAEDGHATLSAAYAQETAVAAGPTATAAEATRAAQHIAEATYVAETATAVSQSIRATDTYLSISGTRQAIEVQATGTAAALMAENVRLMAADEARRLATLREVEQARLDRQRMWNELIPILVLTAVAVAILSLFGMFLYRVLVRPPVQVVPNGGDSPTLLLLAPSGEYRPVHNGGRLTITAPNDVPQLPAPRAPIPSWGAFIRWQDDRQLPIGVDTSGAPILIDRVQEPHVFIAGTTGSGKTTSGLGPFATGMAGLGVHAVVFNARGADFQHLEERPNITVIPQIPDDELPHRLADLLLAAKAEAERRNGVLYQYGKRDWSQLPDYAGEAGEFLLCIDEFLQIVEAAKLVDRAIANAMWAHLVYLTSQGRKYGIYAAITATDPTERALGPQGMAVRSQMARVIFRMKEADASRKILGSHSDFPNGTVGLPTGQFVANVMGRVARGVAFHPSAADVGAFFDARDVRPSRLPDGIIEATEVSPGVWSPAPADMVDMAVLADASSLDSVIGGMRSLRAVGRFLYNLDEGDSVSGQMLDERVKPALVYRQEAMSCPHAVRLLSRTTAS